MATSPSRSQTLPQTLRAILPVRARMLGGGLLVVVFLLLIAASLLTGAISLPVADLLGGRASLGQQDLTLFFSSRVPRTVALMLAGSGLAVAGVIMQMLARNRFVEPATAGTSEAASLGILLVMLINPGMPVFLRMLIAGVCALAGCAVFLLLLRRIPLRSPYVVPLIGLMLGGVISGVTTFIAYQLDMTQALGSFMLGDFSGVLRGRYELLWIAGALTVIAYIAAERFTVMGLGEEISTNLGLPYRRVMMLGLVLVALVTASVVVTCGMIPFVGLIVPNAVALITGDSLRRSLPWVALSGAGLILACDVVGRVIIHPYEIPVGTTMGVVGGTVFLGLLIRELRRGR